ncbi:unnamed protein product [Chrysodeixis includens]|uniref:Uncharacterized protein n=1 Tax=Chrysodeixis includens TaxID=689277 RepID=A0A9N8KWT5_CHRIL|nr:unnamed protein product [Chrysodeixis includens]
MFINCYLHFQRTDLLFLCCYFLHEFIVSGLELVMECLHNVVELGFLLGITFSALVLYYLHHALFQLLILSTRCFVEQAIEHHLPLFIIVEDSIEVECPEEFHLP